MRRLAKAVFVAGAAFMTLGIPMGLAILGTVPHFHGLVFRVGMALLAGGLSGVLILVDLLIVEPRNFRRAREARDRLAILETYRASNTGF